MLYLGFVSFVIPFAFAIAALVTGRTDDRWIRITRRWTLVAWLFLSLGLLLGRRWAYDVLGWGGYWGWDPVEIAAFMPWLTGTAFLHSVMIQEKRGMLKRWNMILIILTYSLVIFGTFLTRSGVLSSVHAFAQSAIGPLFFALSASHSSFHLPCCLCRWNDLKAEGQMTSLLSREAFFLFNNLLVYGHPGGVLLGRDLPVDLGTGHRPESDRWTAVLRKGDRAVVRRSAAVDGDRSPVSLASFHFQDPGTRDLETLSHFTGRSGLCSYSRRTSAGSAAGLLAGGFCGIRHAV